MTQKPPAAKVTPKASKPSSGLFDDDEEEDLFGSSSSSKPASSSAGAIDVGGVTTTESTDTQPQVIYCKMGNFYVNFDGNCHFKIYLDTFIFASFDDGQCKCN